MSATIYGVLQWCRLSPEDITAAVKKVMTGFVYKGEDFYNEIDKFAGWCDACEDDNSVLIWNSDDAGPITVDGKEIGLFVHFDENRQLYDWACTYVI